MAQSKGKKVDWKRRFKAAPLTRAAFGEPGQPYGPRPIEAEWGKLAKYDQDAIVYLAGAYNRLGTHIGWGICSWNTASEGTEEGQQYLATRVPAASIERLLSPLAHEARIRLMQAMYDGPKTSGQLSEATGMKGGNLHYHLKELIFGGYIENQQEGYELTPFGCMMLVTMSMIAEENVKDRGDEGLGVISTWGEYKDEG
jgi:hypothetical protein